MGGADLVIQSLTKYYEGHNMMTGGAVISKTKELAEKMKWVQNVHGNIINPFAAFIILQTTKTMAIRVKQQSKRALAKKYHRDGIDGGMLWFDVEGGSEAAIKLMN